MQTEPHIDKEGDELHRHPVGDATLEVVVAIHKPTQPVRHRVLSHVEHMVVDGQLPLDLHAPVNATRNNRDAQMLDS
jgi:hypothetical protein